MKVNCRTDVGAVRSSNQDACDCGLFSQSSAWAVVCDGMGGANGGNIASEVALKKMRELLLDRFDEAMSPEKIKDLILDVIKQANSAVYDMAQQHTELWGMGTTGVLLIAANGLLHVAHVGDSRAYLKNKDGLTQITMDHSYVQDLVNLGQITQEEARVHPQRNIITRVLGVYPEVLCDYSSFEFSAGDLALACSDGLSNYVEEPLLSEYIREYGAKGDALAGELIRYAIESGGSDNITVAVVSDN